MGEIIPREPIPDNLKNIIYKTLDELNVKVNERQELSSLFSLAWNDGFKEGYYGNEEYTKNLLPMIDWVLDRIKLEEEKEQKVRNLIAYILKQGYILGGKRKNEDEKVYGKRKRQPQI